VEFLAFHFNAVPLVVVNVSPNCRDALAPVGFAVPSLTLAIVAALIVVLLAAWDSWPIEGTSVRKKKPPHKRHTGQG